MWTATIFATRCSGKLVKASEKSGADIVDGGFADWENGHATLFHPAAHDSHRTYQRKLLCQNITSNRIWGRIYRRDLLENHGIYSVEGIDYSEDYAVVARVMYFAKRYFIDDVVYYYRKDNITSYTHDISEKTSPRTSRPASLWHRSSSSMTTRVFTAQPPTSAW